MSYPQNEAKSLDQQVSSRVLSELGWFGWEMVSNMISCLQLAGLDISYTGPPQQPRQYRSQQQPSSAGSGGGGGYSSPPEYYRQGKFPLL